MDLSRFPLLEVKGNGAGTRFVIRLEKNVPVPIDGIKPRVFRSPIVTEKKAVLSYLATDRRNLAYELYLPREAGGIPKLDVASWYLFAYYDYRKHFPSPKILWQDRYIRFVASASRFYGIVVRRETDEQVEEPEEKEKE